VTNQRCDGPPDRIPPLDAAAYRHGPPDRIPPLDAAAYRHGPPDRGMSPLHKMWKDSRLAIAHALLIRAGIQNVNAGDGSGRTSLYVAFLPKSESRGVCQGICGT